MWPTTKDLLQNQTILQELLPTSSHIETNYCRTFSPSSTGRKRTLTILHYLYLLTILTESYSTRYVLLKRVTSYLNDPGSTYSALQQTTQTFLHCPELRIKQLELGRFVQSLQLTYIQITLGITVLSFPFAQTY